MRLLLSIVHNCPPEAPSWLVGLHLLVGLFVYDTFVSLVLSAHCGLFTEMTTEHSGRVRIVKYMGIASLLGSLVIFPLDYLSKSLENYVNFEIATASIALVALITFVLSGLLSPEPQKHYQSDEPNCIKSPQSTKESTRTGLLSVKQIFSNTDWLCVVAANFVHIMRIIGNANFLAIFTENLVSPSLLSRGSKSIGIFYAACNTAPQLFIFIISPLMDRFGAWAVLMGSVALTVLNSVIAISIGRSYSGLIVAFLLIDCILGQSLWPAVFNIFFPNIVDEDFVKHKRKTPLSTLVFTLNALLTKPAISVAPIILANVLNTRRYNEFVKQPDSLTLQQQSSLFDLMFQLICLYPMVLALLEALLLLPYRMKFPQKTSLNPELIRKVSPVPDKEATFL